MYEQEEERRRATSSRSRAEMHPPKIPRGKLRNRKNSANGFNRSFRLLQCGSRFAQQRHDLFRQAENDVFWRIVMSCHGFNRLARTSPMEFPPCHGSLSLAGLMREVYLCPN